MSNKSSPPHIDHLINSLNKSSDTTDFVEPLTKIVRKVRIPGLLVYLWINKIKIILISHDKKIDYIKIKFYSCMDADKFMKYILKGTTDGDALYDRATNASIISKKSDIKNRNKWYYLVKIIKTKNTRSQHDIYRIRKIVMIPLLDCDNVVNKLKDLSDKLPKN